MSERTQKLVSIRRRTDQDLLVLINRELSRGITLVGMAATRNSSFFAQAEKAYATAMVLLPMIAGLSEGDRLQIESSLNELRSRLDQVSMFATVGLFTASVAS
jgi:hypothetical protein